MLTARRRRGGGIGGGGGRKMVAMPTPARLLLFSRSRSLGRTLQQYTPPLTPISRRRRQRPHHRPKSPLLHIRLNKHKPRLSKVHMHRCGSGSAQGGKNVVFVEPDKGVTEVSTVAGEEDCAGTGTVADAEDVAGCEGGAVGL